MIQKTKVFWSSLAPATGGRSGEVFGVLNFLKSAVDDASADQRAKISAIYIVLLAASALVWIWALIALAGRPTLLGTAFLAYVLGLRHAVDADHIATIDNVVRKLMQGGKRPYSVGLFFSLGHSLSIALAVAAIAATNAARCSKCGLWPDWAIVESSAAGKCCWMSGQSCAGAT